MGRKRSVEEGKRAESDCTEINTSLEKKIDRDGSGGALHPFFALVQSIVTCGDRNGS